MAVVIKYRQDGSVCETHCPFTDPQKRGTGKMVGSVACEMCDFYVANDKKYMTLVCSHPGTPIFCKKDRELNQNPILK